MLLSGEQLVVLQQDVRLDKLSRSEFFNIPNKATESKPSQYFLDKQNNPTLLYPTPENFYRYNTV